MEMDPITLNKRIAKLERQMSFLLEHFNLEYEDDPNKVYVSPEVKELVQKGKDMQAIALYQKQNSVSMKEAKQFIDSLKNK